MNKWCDGGLGEKGACTLEEYGVGAMVTGRVRILRMVGPYPILFI